MHAAMPEPTHNALVDVARRHRLDWLALHGSRARGEAHVRSDWDLAYEAVDRPVDPLALRADVVDALGTDRVDVSDARPASALFRFRVARDGILIAERAPGRWSAFRDLAARTWCDLEPVLRPAFERRVARWTQPALEVATFTERAAAIERHLARLESRRPPRDGELLPMTDATDAVVLHLWQAIQGCIDLAVSACVARDLGAPETYAGAFERLARAGLLDPDLADRLRRAAGFWNFLVHNYEALDLGIALEAAHRAPDDLREALGQLARALPA